MKKDSYSKAERKRVPNPGYQEEGFSRNRRSNFSLSASKDANKRSRNPSIPAIAKGLGAKQDGCLRLNMGKHPYRPYDAVNESKKRGSYQKERRLHFAMHASSLPLSKGNTRWCLASAFSWPNQEMKRGFSYRFESGKDPRNQGNPMGRSLRSDAANDKINDKINGVFSSLFLPSL